MKVRPWILRFPVPLRTVLPLALCGLGAFGAHAQAPKVSKAKAPTSVAATFDLSKPEDALKVARKMSCSLEDGKTIIYWWKGGAFSRVPGERDRHLFNVEGFNIRQCATHADPKRGYGYRSVSREIMLYLDPETGQVLRKWKNPWSGQEVEVIHVANDPVNGRPNFALSEDGKPYKFEATWKKDRVWTSGEGALFYTNPLGGDYQEFVGGEYHAMEMINTFAYAKDLLDATKPTLDRITLSWARVSEWLPWMEQGDRAGMMIFSTVGKRVKSFDDLSPVVKDEVKSNYPAYMQPPPVDDNRPNETSWSYFKKVFDAKKKGK